MAVRHIQNTGSGNKFPYTFPFSFYRDDRRTMSTAIGRAVTSASGRTIKEAT